MIYVLYFIHVLVSIFLILVVLLQQGKGADLSVFGGGATQAAFGARGAATLLHKLTVFGFVAFTLTTLGIGIIQSRGSGGSVMTGVVNQTPAETSAEPAAAAETPAAETPAAETPASATPAPEPAAGAGDAGADEGSQEPPPADNPESGG